jgi:hypothetical protein
MRWRPELCTLAAVEKQRSWKECSDRPEREQRKYDARDVDGLPF